MGYSLPVASSLDTGRAVWDILLPIVAQGAILRRPRLTQLSDRLQVDDRALRRFKALRAKYGEGPLLLRLPGRTVALVLDPGHVKRLLAETPEPFSAATNEKVGALRHFQPHAVLATDPPLRGPRRSINEEALDTRRPVHRSGAKMMEIVRAELAGLDGLTLGYPEFRERWNRVTRRVVLGDKAAGDTELTDLLDALRGDANWAQFHPRDRDRRVRFRTLIESYVANPAPDSLVAGLPEDDQLDSAGQVPHWLFAFDAAGIALWRLLAVVAVRPEVAAAIAGEARAPAGSPLLAYAGAAVEESVRLWPTTMVILREGRIETWWDRRSAPAGTEFVIVVSAFHRDQEALEFAHRLVPEVWLDGRSDGEWPLIPFSAGPAVCPGRNVVLLTTGTAASELVSSYRLDLDPVTRRKLGAGELPATFDHTAPRLGFWQHGSEEDR